MNTNAFKNIQRLFVIFKYRYNEDENVLIDKILLLTSKSEYEIEFLSPFRDELNEKLENLSSENRYKSVFSYLLRLKETIWLVDTQRNVLKTSEPDYFERYNSLLPRLKSKEIHPDRKQLERLFEIYAIVLLTDVVEIIALTSYYYRVAYDEIVKSFYFEKLPEIMQPGLLLYKHKMQNSKQNLSGTTGAEEPNEKDIKKLKIGAKHYALVHWIKIKLGKESIFEKNDEGKWPANYIKTRAKKLYKLKDGQGFYKSFTELDPTNTVAIARSFGKDYKDKLIAASENDGDVISELKKWPN
jgi:hypothetical protein